MVNSKRSRIIAHCTYWPSKSAIAQIIAEYAESTITEKLLMLLARSRGSCIDYKISHKNNCTLLFQLRWEPLHDWHVRKSIPLEDINAHHMRCKYTLRFISQYKTILPDNQKYQRNFEENQQISFLNLVNLLTTSDWRIVNLDFNISFTGISIFKSDRDAVYLHLQKLLTRY